MAKKRNDGVWVGPFTVEDAHLVSPGDRVLFPRSSARYYNVFSKTSLARGLFSPPGGRIYTIVKVEVVHDYDYPDGHRISFGLDIGEGGKIEYVSFRWFDPNSASRYKKEMSQYSHLMIIPLWGGRYLQL